ncbi:MAG TPA: hypothetical protein VM677_27165 [Actinokineospora sp.]|nr:hypothetical protein [Actinokineospora sp.]
MPRVIPAVANNSAIGLVLALTAPTVDNDAILNNGRRVLHVKNAAGAPINVTIKAPAAATPGGIPLADKVVAVANGTEAEFGPWGPEWQQADGYVWIDYSAVTSITRQVREMPRVM